MHACKTVINHKVYVETCTRRTDICIENSVVVQLGGLSPTHPIIRSPCAMKCLLCTITMCNEMKCLLCRFKRQHMLLCGILYSSNKPLMNMYLRPIVDDLLRLFREGKQIHVVVCRHSMYTVHVCFVISCLLAPRNCC